MRLAYLSLALIIAATAVWLAYSGPPDPLPTSSKVVLRFEPESAPPDGPERLLAEEPASPTPTVKPGTPAKKETPAAKKIPTEGRPEAMPAPSPAAAPTAPPAPAPKPGPDPTAPPAASPAEPNAPATAPEGNQVAEAPEAEVRLQPAPDPALVEETRLGALPRISEDGRHAWKVYARPFHGAGEKPRIAVIINNLGLSGAATEAAIQRLAGPVTLAFAPYSPHLTQWIDLARAAGHEVLLDLPMEPTNYRPKIRGTHTLLTSLTAEQNVLRLHWALGRVSGYVGLVNQMGSRFTTSEQHLTPVLTELKKRGLLFVDSRAAYRSVATRIAAEVGLPWAANNVFIDSKASRGAIDKRLAQLEAIARAKGIAVGIGGPFPVTIDRLEYWAKGLDDKGLTLVPVSAVVTTK